MDVSATIKDVNRRYLATLPCVLTLVLTGCGDDDGSRTDADSQATDSIATYLSDGHGLLNRDDAHCVAKSLIEHESASDLQKMGFLKDDLTVNDKPNPAVAPAFADAWLACSSLGVWVVRGAGSGVADCIDETVQTAAARNFLLADLGSDEADTDRARVTGDVISMCRAGDH